MFRFWHKAVVVALSAATVGGLAMVESASAALPSVEVTVCNLAASEQRFVVGGKTKDEKTEWGPKLNVQANSCTLVSGWWWATGESIAVEHQIAESNIIRSYFPLDSSLQDGGGYTVNISSNGP